MFEGPGSLLSFPDFDVGDLKASLERGVAVNIVFSTCLLLMLSELPLRNVQKAKHRDRSEITQFTLSVM